MAKNFRELLADARTKLRSIQKSHTRTLANEEEMQLNSEIEMLQALALMEHNLAVYLKVKKTKHDDILFGTRKNPGIVGAAYQIIQALN